MKTGRLIKLQRPGGEIHVYLYREGGLYRASIYLMSVERGQPTEPLQRLESASEEEVEASARAFVDLRFPKGA